jgi:hypothetical protein
MHGPSREVMFPQDHQPGQLGAFDFTHCEELGVTIAGAIFVHLMFQFVLAWSGWRYIEIAFGETYEALLSGLQGALWKLGGVPAFGGALRVIQSRQDPDPPTVAASEAAAAGY